MPGKLTTNEADRSESTTEPSVDIAFRRAALIQGAKVSARRRQLGARRRQRTN